MDVFQKELNQYLQETFNFLHLTQADHNLKARFEELLQQPFRENVTKIETGDSSYVNFLWSFLNSWKTMQRYSGITKGLPLLLTGR